MVQENGETFFLMPSLKQRGKVTQLNLHQFYGRGKCHRMCRKIVDIFNLFLYKKMWREITH